MNKLANLFRQLIYCGFAVDNSSSACASPSTIVPPLIRPPSLRVYPRRLCAAAGIGEAGFPRLSQAVDGQREAPATRHGKRARRKEGSCELDPSPPRLTSAPAWPPLSPEIIPIPPRRPGPPKGVETQDEKGRVGQTASGDPHPGIPIPEKKRIGQDRPWPPEAGLGGLT